MFANKLAASVLSVLLVTAAFGPAATAASAGAATSSQQQAYAGTHVSFDTTSNAVVDYAVDGETVMESVRVQSKSEAQSRGDVSVGVGLSAVTDLSGAAVSLDSKTETRAEVTAESGAELHAHDNARGVLVVRAGESGQYVTANLSSSAQAESEGNNRVVVTREDGTQGVFIVVGDGEVTVNNQGNVSAELAEDSQLVFRTYTEGRDDADAQQEQLIADGKAAAEVYVMQDGGAIVADTVNYGQETTINVTQKSEGRVAMTAERTEHEGKVVITTVSNEVVRSPDDLQVTVDGEAAARASSYSDLQSAIGGDTSKFLVRQRSSAQGNADVLVAVNHFSTREVVLSSTSETRAQGYAGTHTSFEASNNAVVDYAVDGETVMESVKIQSKSQAQSQGGIDVGTQLSAVTDFTGAALSVDAKTETSATVTTDSGAQLQAHDNPRGILVIRSGDEAQYVAINVSASSRTESESGQRVVVTTEDGTRGTFIVVGDGEVTVNERGNVTADLGENSQLVFRSYADGRDDEDTQQEQLIANGTAAAEVYVMQKSEGSSETVADVVQYGEDTSIEVTQQSEGTVKMTAERSEHQGKIIITSVSDAVISSTEDMEVTVDGEAAARASSYSALESATNNGDTSKFLVRQQSSADASADVLVAVNHFSTREITIEERSSENSGSDGSTTSGDENDGSNSDGANEEPTSSDGPGFGIGVALVALIGVALYAYRRY
jgi:PGF-CTERM protein